MKLKILLVSFTLTLLAGIAFFTLHPASQSPGFKTIPPAEDDAGFVPYYITRHLPSILQNHDALRQGFVNIKMRGYQGAGIILEKGLVLTNAHVVVDENGRQRHRWYRVTLNGGGRAHATYVAHSRTYDVALLRIPEDFGTPLPLADEDVTLHQPVMALGNPSRGDWVVSGDVKALSLMVRHKFVPDRSPRAVRMFVMGAQPVQGYSGGPVVNPFTGQVVGITVGLVARYVDPLTGKWVTPDKDVGVAMHIRDVLREVRKLKAAL